MVGIEQYQMMKHIVNSEKPTYNYLIQNCPLGMSWSLDYASSLLSELQDIKLIQEDENELFSLTENGQKLLTIYIENQSGQKDVERLENEKLKLEVDDLRNKFFDYESKKWKTKWSFILSVIAVGLTVIGLIIQWMNRK